MSRKRSREELLPLLLFDEECSLCNRFKLSLERLEGSDKINMISARNPDIFELFPELDPEQCLIDVHYIDESGQIYLGAEVVSILLKKFPAVSKFAWLLDTSAGQSAVKYFHNMTSYLRREALLKDCPGCKKRHTKKPRLER
ncbi:MAG: DUF393 domain-containing protein [Halobacteriovoraceae bacterium]|nr:DUF393 domain-containing protein [Halobacteriovoraceae bacterium]